MATIASLDVNLNAQTAQFVDGMGRAERANKSFMKTLHDMERSQKGLERLLKGGAVFGLANFALNRVTNALDQMAASATRFENGEINLDQLGLQITDSAIGAVPVLGNLYTATVKIQEAFDGTTFGAIRAAAAIKRLKDEAAAIKNAVDVTGALEEQLRKVSRASQLQQSPGQAGVSKELFEFEDQLLALEKFRTTIDALASNPLIPLSKIDALNQRYERLAANIKKAHDENSRLAKAIAENARLDGLLAEQEKNRIEAGNNTMRAYEDSLRVLKDLDDQFKNDPFRKMKESLEDQINLFGATIGQTELYRAAIAGLSDEQIEQLRPLADRLDKLNAPPAMSPSGDSVRFIQGFPGSNTLAAPLKGIEKNTLEANKHLQKIREQTQNDASAETGFTVVDIA